MFVFIDGHRIGVLCFRLEILSVGVLKLSNCVVVSLNSHFAEQQSRIQFPTHSEIF